MSRTPIRCPRCKTPPEPDNGVRLIPVRCPECGKTYTRATVGSTVEIACRKCKATTVVMVVAA